MTLNTESFIGHRQCVRLARAPLRVSLAGGGTDLASYASRFGGAVLSLAIDRYVSVALYPRSFDGAIFANWEFPEQASLARDFQNAFGRAALERLGIVSNAQIATFSDAPSGTGVGGSGAFLVAFLHAGRYALDPTVDRLRLAEEASAIEMEDLNLCVGKQDHYIAALGGLQLMRFARDLSVDVERVAAGPACRRYFSERLLLFYTNQRRRAHDVLFSQANKTVAGDRGVLSSLDAIGRLVAPMLAAIRADDPEAIGPLLTRHWEGKSQLAPTDSTPFARELFRLAVDAGADGGKLLGAGGGGFLLVSTKEGRQDAVRAVLERAGAREFRFGCDDLGSTAVSLPI